MRQRSNGGQALPSVVLLLWIFLGRSPYALELAISKKAPRSAERRRSEVQTVTSLSPEWMSR